MLLCSIVRLEISGALSICGLLIVGGLVGGCLCLFLCSCLCRILVLRVLMVVMGVEPAQLGSVSIHKGSRERGASTCCVHGQFSCISQLLWS